MRVTMAYTSVVLIWATTPLGVKWSNSTLHFTAAVGLRMSLACVLCLLIIAYRKQALFQNTRDWQTYFAGALCLFPTMGIVYWSAQFISSGMIAVVFGLYPFFVGLLSRFFFRQSKLDLHQLFALGIAFSGIVLIQWEHVNLGAKAGWGISAVILSTLIFASATLWMKKIGGNIEPFRQNTGVLLFAVPGFLVLWFLSGAPMPEALDFKSALGVSYLVVCGSMIGSTLFFFVLQRCSAMTTALIPLLTPVLAMSIGVLVDGETLSFIQMVGALMIVGSLAIYQGIFKLKNAVASRKKSTQALEAPGKF